MIRHSDAESSRPYRERVRARRGAIRDQSRGGLLGSMISGNSAETPVRLSLSCSLIGEIIMLGGDGAAEPGSASLSTGITEKCVVQRNHFVIFEC